MTQQKLYTEDEIRRTFGSGFTEARFKRFMNELTPIEIPTYEEICDDWFCPKCDSYVSSESVTFEETHQICGTGVIIKETKHMAQQTALQFLIEQLKGYEYDGNDFIFTGVITSELIEQAKQMEKEQMKGMYTEGGFAQMRYFDGKEFITGEQYYNENYNK